MMYDRFDQGSGTDVWGFIFMVLMMALVFLGIVLLVRYLANSSHSSNNENSALEILKNRYAKGEIEKKEFDEKRKDLKA
jgi:putative membrane protein